MRNLQSLNAACDVDDSVGVCSYAHVHCSVMTKYWVPSAFSAEEAQVFTPKHVHRLLCTACYISHHCAWVAPYEPILQGL